MKKFWILLLFIFLLGCKKNEPHPYSFYYWKVNLSLSETEQKALQNSTDAHLYTRFFDVDKIEGKFQPVAVLTKSKDFVTTKEIVPVIFMTNRSFLNIEKEEITFLAEHIHTLIAKKKKELSLSDSEEIQIDCDWTAGTRDDYFRFLEELKRVSGKNITSTLRLHQVKDRDKMGIPPVEKVYLMCYSTSSPLESSDKNSILDLSILKAYLGRLQYYPIKKIDIALPIYSWGIITNHLGKHRLINGLNNSELAHKNFKRISESEVEVVEDGFYFGFYLNKGFKIKVEQIDNKTLDETVSFLNKKISNFNIVYYQLDEKFIKNTNFNH